MNTLLLSAATGPVPDVIALVATLGNDGIVTIPGVPATGFFSVATSNVGAGGDLTVSADTGGVPLPLDVSICQTDTSTGACLSPPQTSVHLTVTAGATSTFAVFAQALGQVLFDPANHRLFVRIVDGQGVSRGAASAAVRTQ